MPSSSGGLALLGLGSQSEGCSCLLGLALEGSRAVLQSGGSSNRSGQWGCRAAPTRPTLGRHQPTAPPSPPLRPPAPSAAGGERKARHCRWPRLPTARYRQGKSRKNHRLPRLEPPPRASPAARAPAGDPGASPEEGPSVPVGQRASRAPPPPAPRAAPPLSSSTSCGGGLLRGPWRSTDAHAATWSGVVAPAALQRRQ